MDRGELDREIALLSVALRKAGIEALELGAKAAGAAKILGSAALRGHARSLQRLSESSGRHAEALETVRAGLRSAESGGENAALVSSAARLSDAISKWHSSADDAASDLDPSFWVDANWVEPLAKALGRVLEGLEAAPLDSLAELFDDEATELEQVEPCPAPRLQP